VGVRHTQAVHHADCGGGNSEGHNWVGPATYIRGKCEEAMREVLGAGRGVQAGEVKIPAMAAEAGRETRQGAESDEESDGCDGAQDTRLRARIRLRVCVITQKHNIGLLLLLRLSRKALSFAPRS
jgi:hypothetical protein